MHTGVNRVILVGSHWLLHCVFKQVSLDIGQGQTIKQFYVSDFSLTSPTTLAKFPAADKVNLDREITISYYIKRISEKSIYVKIYTQSLVLDLLADTSNKETFLQDFLEIHKRTLQKSW